MYDGNPAVILELTSTTLDDSGLYHCVATYGEQEIVSSVTVDILGNVCFINYETISKKCYTALSAI